MWLQTYPILHISHSDYYFLVIYRTLYSDLSQCKHLFMELYTLQKKDPVTEICSPKENWNLNINNQICFHSHRKTKQSFLYISPTGVTENIYLPVICIYGSRILQAQLNHVYRLFLSSCSLEDSPI